MKNKKKSPVKFFAALGAALGASAAFATPVGIAATVAGVGLYRAGKKAKARDRALRGQLSDLQADFEERIQQYEELKFRPIDVDALKQENVFEDLEIDTEAFEASRRNFLQSQANILASLSGAASSSGAASLATALSTQATKQAEQQRLTIAEQINKNKQLEIAERARLNNQIRELELANMEGARQFEIDQLSTLLGIEGQKIAGVRGDIAGRQQMYGDIAGGIGNIIGSAIGGS
tara:strand:+ start:34 stop:738 length:705 start_codon:yes stop_codon:yes gene_type:complete